MKRFQFFISSLSILFICNLTAQEKWSIEFRPGLNFPTSDLGNADSNIGYGFEITGAYKIIPHLAVYTGWGWNQFNGEDQSSSEEITFEESGYTLGIQFVHPMGNSEFSYFGRAGATFNHIGLENNAGDIKADSGHGLGWQVAAGVEYEFGPNLYLRPELRYRSLNRDVEIENISTDLKLNYISIGMGLVWAF